MVVKQDAAKAWAVSKCGEHFGLDAVVFFDDLDEYIVGDVWADGLVSVNISVVLPNYFTVQRLNDLAEVIVHGNDGNYTFYFDENNCLCLSLTLWTTWEEVLMSNKH